MRVNELWSVDEVIKKVLTAHRVGKLEPPLKYDAPHKYDLRLHEGQLI